MSTSIDWHRFQKQNQSKRCKQKLIRFGEQLGVKSRTPHNAMEFNFLWSGFTYAKLAQTNKRKVKLYVCDLIALWRDALFAYCNLMAFDQNKAQTCTFARTWTSISFRILVALIFHAVCSILWVNGVRCICCCKQNKTAHFFSLGCSVFLTSCVCMKCGRACIRLHTVEMKWIACERFHWQRLVFLMDGMVKIPLLPSPCPSQPPFRCGHCRVNDDNAGNLVVCCFSRKRKYLTASLPFNGYTH